MDKNKQKSTKTIADRVVSEAAEVGRKPCDCMPDRGQLRRYCNGSCDTDIHGNSIPAEMDRRSGVAGSESRRAMRFNSGKSELSYILDFPKTMEGMAKVMMAGADKGYPRNNWKKGMPAEEVIDSLMRHLLKRINGQQFDPETGLDHFFHVVVNAAFLCEFEGDLGGFKPCDPAMVDSLIDGD